MHDALRQGGEVILLELFRLPGQILARRNGRSQHHGVIEQTPLTVVHRPQPPAAAQGVASLEVLQPPLALIDAAIRHRPAQSLQQAAGVRIDGGQLGQRQIAQPAFRRHARHQRRGGIAEQHPRPESVRGFRRKNQHAFRNLVEGRAQAVVRRAHLLQVRRQRRRGFWGEGIGGSNHDGGRESAIIKTA